MTNPTVAVVILSWNGLEWLKKFIPPLIENTLYENAELVVADNCSTDNTINYLSEHFPQITIVKNETNEGFAKGYNSALSKLNADIFVLLNQDVEVGKNWLTNAISSFENPQVAAVQPKIKAYHQKDHFEYAGASGGFIDVLGYPFCRGRIFDHIEKDQGQYNNETECFWASGACMLVKSDVFKKAGELDGDFFAHMEEIDLCWRIKNMGYKILVNPRSEVFHVGGGSLNYGNPRKTFLNFRNNIAMLFKNLPGSKLIPIIFLRLLLDGLAGLQALLKGNWKDTVAIIKAHFNFYINLPTWIVKRKAARKLALNANMTGMFKGSILLHYFLKGRRDFPFNS